MTTGGKKVSRSRTDAGEPFDEKMRAMRAVQKDLEGAWALGGGLPSDSSACRQLDDFRLRREIGRGGMGIVYEAEQVSLGRRVALKVLPVAATLDPRQIQRFQTEARAAARLHHSNIVPVFGVGCDRGVYYYAMQFIEGEDLGEVVRRLRGGEPEGVETGSDGRARVLATLTSSSVTSSGAYFRRVAALAKQAAEALAYAHSSGVIHRDIKPGNLLLDAQGNLWITDFGLAKLERESNVTRSGDLLGTLRYMSPEQALGKRGVVDHRSDVYSLGVTLYELLTLQPAIEGQDREEILEQIARGEPKLPRRIDSQVPRDLETIVLKAMEQRPEERYAAAGDVAADLRRFLEGRPILARPPTLRERLSKWSRRHTALVGAALVILLLSTLASVSFAWFLHRQNEAARRAVYVAELPVAMDAWQSGNAVEAREIVSRHREDSWRGWEWYFLRSLLDSPNTVVESSDTRVLSVAWSPDGALLASAAEDGRLIVRELRTGDIAWEHNATEPIRQLTWNKDGSRLVLGRRSALDLMSRTGEVLTSFTVDGVIRSIALHPSRPLVALAHSGKLAILRTDRPGASPTHLDIRYDSGRDNPWGHEVFSLAWHPEAERLAAGFARGVVLIWDSARNWRPEQHLRPGPQVYGLAWSPDGQWIVSVSGETLVQWRPDRSAADIVHKVEPGLAPRWSPNGQRFALFGGTTVEFFEADGEARWKLRGHSSAVHSASWGPEGHRIALASSDDTVTLHDAAEAPTFLALDGRVDATFSPTGPWLATVGKRGEGESEDVVVFDLRSGAETARLRAANTDPQLYYLAIAFSPDGRLIAAGNSRGVLTIWDWEKRTIERTATAHAGGEVRCLDWGPDGRLATGGMDGGCRVWDPTNGRLEKELPTVGLIETVLWSPGGNWLAAGTSSRRLSIWNARDWRLVHDLERPHRGGAMAPQRLAWSPDAQYLASGTSLGHLLVWQTRQGKVIADARTTGPITSVAWSPDGRLLATGGRSLALWSPLDGKELLTLWDDPDPTFVVAWSRNGRRLAIATMAELRVYDATRGYELEAQGIEIR